jgi:Domain of unknown function (DUF4439)
MSGASAASQAVSALQQALAAEQAASYGFGVVGAHLAGRALTTATADWVAHQRARDQLEQLLIARGATPAPAAVAYRLPFAVGTVREAVSLAIVLADRVAAAYLGLVAVSEPTLRQLGAARLRACALQAARWRGSTVAFPGLPAR